MKTTYTDVRRAYKLYRIENCIGPILAISCHWNQRTECRKKGEKDQRE